MRRYGACGRKRATPAAASTAFLRSSVAERAALELNDADNAARLLAEHGDELIYVTGKGWAVWDGARYATRNGNLAAFEKAHKLRGLVLEEAEWARSTLEVPDWLVKATKDKALHGRPLQALSDDDARDQVRKERAQTLRAHATKCGNVVKIKAALESAAARRRVNVDDLDANPWALVVSNGQVDLRALAAIEPPQAAEAEEIVAAKRGWLRPVDRATLPTKCAGAAFDPAADCPKWRAFLVMILPDPEVRACVQRILGAALVGEHRAQIMVILRGQGGNGKSTFLHAVRAVFGERDGYCESAPAELVLETATGGAGASTPEEVNLPGARAILLSEPGKRDSLSAKKIKALTGSDRKMRRALYGAHFEWRPQGIRSLSCNRTPRIRDEDHGTARRLVFVPFEVDLTALPSESQRAQRDVEAELRAEASGILNWMLEGPAAFMERGVDPPAAMGGLKAIEMEGADPIGKFLADTTAAATTGRINVSDLADAYSRWADTEGHALLGPVRLREGMAARGVQRSKTQGISYWRGIRWTPAAAPFTANAPTAAVGAAESEEAPFCDPRRYPGRRGAAAVSGIRCAGPPP